MGHLICGNTVLPITDNIGINIKKDNSMIVTMVFKEDTMIASKEWVKENLDKVEQWAQQK